MKVISSYVHTFNKKYIESSYFKYVLIFIISFSLSQIKFILNIHPVGISFILGVDINYLPFAALGGLASTLFFGDLILSVKYIALILVMSTCKWIFSQILFAKNIYAINAISILFSIILSEIANFIYMNIDGYKLLSVIAEIILSIFLSTMFLECNKIVTSNKYKSTLNIIYLSFAFSFICISIDRFFNITMSLSIIIVFYMIINFSYYVLDKRSFAFCASSIFVLNFFNNNMQLISGGIILCNIISYKIRSYGKIVFSLFFLVVCTLSSISFIDKYNVFILLEILISCVLFIILPISKLYDLNEYDSISIKNNKINEYFSNNLSSMAYSLNNISSEINDFNAKSYNLNRGDISSVYTKTMDEVCSKCKNKLYCCTSHYNILYDAFNKSGKILLNNEKLSFENAHSFIKNSCKKPHILINSLNNNYTLFMQLNDNKNKIDLYKENIVEQFSFIARAIQNLGYSLNQIDYMDIETTDKVKQFFNENKIKYNSVYVICEKNKTKVLNVNMNKKHMSQKDLRFLRDEISKICRIDLEMPILNETEKEIMIIFLQKGNFVVDSYIYQISKKESELNGDTACVFRDIKGNCNIILCDGMGTGEKANLESEITLNIVKNLIKSGINTKNSMYILNSALMSKNSDECFSTVDITSINIYTGKMNILKAGAVNTYVKKNNKVFSINSQSMPVGILSNIHYFTNQIYLNDSSIIVMVSDGVIASGDSWLCSIIDMYNGNSPKELAKSIANTAKMRNENLYEDDITVVTSFVKSI